MNQDHTDLSHQWFLEDVERFKKYSNDEIIQAFNDQIGNPGMVSRRMSYLSAIHHEFKRRGFDYSLIGDTQSLSFARKVVAMSYESQIVLYPIKEK